MIPPFVNCEQKSERGRSSFCFLFSLARFCIVADSGSYKNEGFLIYEDLPRPNTVQFRRKYRRSDIQIIPSPKNTGEIALLVEGLGVGG
ncbi:hypothetical protein F0562_028393 [Nyssa sinensis]|uniref:Uncharacterized protein n=1 Tax=Nyssa sinensis TaxID=561372 RepID=A0A5J5AXV5_9ASTE|nr:hypothetical protein F0562_028393 [Nyssa sinensis]